MLLKQLHDIRRYSVLCALLRLLLLGQGELLLLRLLVSLLLLSCPEVWGPSLLEGGGAVGWARGSRACPSWRVVVI